MESVFSRSNTLLLLVSVHKPLDLRRALALGQEVVNSYDFFEAPSYKSPTAARRYLIGGRVRHDACVSGVVCLYK